jgi:hypothetical protein
LGDIFEVILFCKEPATNQNPRRIATRPFFEVGCACGVNLALKVVALARQRLNAGVSLLFYVM